MAVRRLGNWKINNLNEILDYCKNKEPDRVKEFGTNNLNQTAENLNGNEVDLDYRRWYVGSNHTDTNEYYNNELLLTALPEEFFEQEGLEYPAAKALVLKLNPACVTIPHKDFFPSGGWVTNGNENAMRYWIPLEDYEHGNAFFVEDEAIVNWRAGDVFTWAYEDLHGSANAGLHSRYALVYYTNKKL